MHKKRVLVTGSNGLLGQKLIALLKTRDDIATLATSRGENRVPYTDGYQYFTADLTSVTQVTDLFETAKPSVVIHTAAMTHADVCERDKEGCWQSNVKAVEYLVNACEKHSVFLIHLSTDFIFDGLSGPYSEDDEPAPVNFYGWSKYAAEKIIQKSAVRWAIARTVLVYGIAHDMSRSNLILWAKNALEQGKAIKVVSDQLRTPTLAEDLATGCLLIAEKEEEGVFNISGSDVLTPYEMAIHTARFYGLDTSLITEVNADTFKEPAQRPLRTGFKIGKAISVLGYHPHSFSEGLAIMAGQTAGSHSL